MCRKTRRTAPWSSLEVLLSTVTIVLFAVCVGLIVLSFLVLQTGNEGQTGSSNSSFSGTLTISEGASFTEELRNSSSGTFKSLAYDAQLLITEAYELGSLSSQFRSCRVTSFSPGSVIVHFTVLFRDVVEVTVVQQQLISGLQNIPDSTLIINSSSIHVTDISTTQIPPTATPETVKCPDEQKFCRDNVTCVPINLFCDGETNCPDASDESHSTCATVCDGQFLLLGPSGFFHSDNFPLDYDSSTECLWIIRVNEGLSIKIDFETFDTEQEFDVLNVYEGIGAAKTLEYSLSGSSPGVVWILSHEATVKFSSDLIYNQQGFNATYRAENLTHLSNEAKINCSFEEGFCFWRQDADGDGDWMRKNGSSLPALSGPNFDHTFANQSGYYIITPTSPGSWEKIFRLRSFPLAPATESMCLRFWYHMFGENVRRLTVNAERNSNVVILFQKEGNYGNNWNYGQVTIKDTTNQTIVFEARKQGTRNDIALDDLSMTSGPCGLSPPDPTHVPLPTTPHPGPADCGGPFDLYASNSTFSLPNYPHSYGHGLSCVWILHAEQGQNIRLHFQDFSLEAAYDVLEIRDGVAPHSTLLSVLTGERDFPDIFSTTSEMTLMFFSDSSGSDRGFLANFSTGFNLGQPEACQAGEYQCRSGVCVSTASVCDGIRNCPDISDEANCVHLSAAQFPGAPRLKIEIQSRLYTACSSGWSSHFSNYFCRYLGYRSGTASFVSVLGEEAPFVVVTQTADGSVDVKPSEKCPSEKVVSLHCDNQPCGKRKVVMKTESGWSVVRESRVKMEDEIREGVEGRIVGGEDAVKGAWPWIASLRWTGRHACGGTLIDSQWLVTAAHCVYGKSVHLSNWNVILGLHAQYESNTSDRQNHQIDQIIINQNYNRRTKDSDIALIHLQNKVNFTDYIQPICLPNSAQQFAAGRKCVIAGWGRLTEGGTVADVLQQAVLPLINNSVCQARLPEYNITERMVCAGYPEGGIDTCQGDSGGPLMCEEGDGSWVLAGVTSFGVGCARPGRPGVYALVTHFTDWILETRRLYTHWDGAR
ncbi:enteropeptidase [Ictalurus punctatus]|uniref:Enteropeptidase n=1 Tax=Ictalurus punctatus TaxID=7998 RepID=A0A2D0SXN8_ICTPU|nr:enteropeptidase [Ictalurus punctatus]